MQQTLFPTSDTPKSTNASSVNVIISKITKVNSKEKLDFQKAISKNNELKRKEEYVKDMSIYALEMSHKLSGEIANEYVDKLLEELTELDKAYNNRLYKFTNKRKEKLSEIILGKATNLVQEYDRKEAQVFIDKYLPELNEMEQEEVMNHSISMFEHMFGIKIDKEDFTNGKPDFEKIEMKYGNALNERSNSHKQFEESEIPNRKKTKKQIEREAKESAEEKMLNADLQSIFKELAKKLHPDTEMDPKIKGEKQELMKQLVNARDDKDIFELLKIRLAVLADDENLNIFDDSSMKRLTKMIREKNRILEGKIYAHRYHSPILSNMGAIYMDEAKMKSAIMQAIDLQIDKLHENIYSVTSTMASWKLSNKNLNRAIDQYILNEDPFDSLFDY